MSVWTYVHRDDVATSCHVELRRGCLTGAINEPAEVRIRLPTPPSNPPRGTLLAESVQRQCAAFLISTRSRAMSFILWIIVGGLLGWVASMMMGTNDQQGK